VNLLLEIDQGKNCLDERGDGEKQSHGATELHDPAALFPSLLHFRYGREAIILRCKPVDVLPPQM
jgi:hypothetical protein